MSHEYSVLFPDGKQVLHILERSAKTMVESEANWKQLTDFQLLNKTADNSFVLMHLKKVCIKIIVWSSILFILPEVWR